MSLSKKGVLAFTLVVHSSLAQCDEAVLSELDFFAAQPPVISGTRLHQSVADSPMAMTVIDREMIEASGAREMFEVFRLIPGMQVGSNSGHEHTVTYHGLSDTYARRMQILVDGRSVYHQGIGGVEWTELPLALEDVERIEVIRGPNAATYGSNAFLGTINIITRHPSRTSGVTLSARRGTNDIRDSRASYSDTSGKLSYRLSLDYLSDDGFPDRHDSKLVRTANLSSAYQINNEDQLELRVGYNNGPREVGSTDSATHQPGTVRRHSTFQHLRWSRLLPNENEYSFQLYHNLVKFDYVQQSLLFEPILDNSDAERFDVEFYNARRLDDTKRLVWGASARRDEITSNLMFNQTDPMNTDLFRLFGHYEWQFQPKLTLNAGLMWEDHDITGADLSPRVALNYQAAPNHTFRASYSAAERAPILFEEHANVWVNLLPNPDLGFPAGGSLQTFTSNGNMDPETIISRELGYVGEFPNLGMTLDLKLYHDSLNGLITYEATPTSPIGLPNVWRNVHWLTITGAEGSINWKPSRRSRLIASYAYADADGNDSEVDRSVPQHTASLLGIYDLTPQVKLSANYAYLSKMQWLDTSAEIPDHSRLDLRLGYDFKLRGKAAQVELVAQDILGDHANFKTTNKSEETYYLGFRINL